MGRFDRRSSQKMRQRKGQTKKKERLARKAAVARASRQKRTKPARERK
jgi:hypothetical protein